MDFFVITLFTKYGVDSLAMLLQNNLDLSEEESYVYVGALIAMVPILGKMIEYGLESEPEQHQFAALRA